MTTKRPATIGELRASGWQSRTVKEEMRQNLLSRMKAGETLFPGIVGFEQTVIPQLVNAILSRHNFILLGLRGQAKTRIIRRLQNLLDESQPVLAGTQLNEDPFHPVSPKGLALVASLGDKAPIEWRSREERYHEKLATPDVSIADLIGDIDPIKAAREKLDISNEEVIHWGIIPRTNRGIFAINELPDLQPRIQVGLLNILEESDIQVRGFPLRLPLDICIVFTANPEDYTNRGNIITPLKDRIDSQIITHYPRSLDQAKAITADEISDKKSHIVVPEFIRDIVEQVTFQARSSEYVDQSSGVSARMSISAYENFLSNIERRALMTRDSENDLFPRVCDLYAIIPAVTGKVELVYEGEQEGPALVAHNLIGKAVTSVFLGHFPPPAKEKKRGDDRLAENPYEAVIDWFGSGKKLELGDELSYDEYRQRLLSVAGLNAVVRKYNKTKDEREQLLWMELVLEGLHHHNLIAREVTDSSVRYGDVFSNMLKGISGADD